MSERAADDVRGEPRRAAAAAGGAAAARQQQQQPPQPQRQQPPRRLRPEDGGPAAASTSAAAAMATVGERRPLPSPEAMLGQSWNLWVEASKLPGKDGTELDESFKEFGKNREVMGLCREGEFSPLKEFEQVPGVFPCWLHQGGELLAHLTPSSPQRGDAA